MPTDWPPLVVLLGPQRRAPTVSGVLAELGLRGPFALVTAGWREREGEDDDLRAAIGGEAINLSLYRRVEALREGDEVLREAAAWRRRQLRAQRELYRLRLDPTMRAARTMLRRADEPELLEPEIDSCFDAVRALDAHLLGRVAAIEREYAERARLAEHRALAEARHEVAALVDGAEAVLLAGGHVASLLNRLRQFDLGPLLAQKRLCAWSAGAMVLCETIVLFHDSPPQGAGFAEVLDRGLGLCPGLFLLPGAARRLRLDDPLRVGLMTRRFSHLRAVPLDAGDRLDLRDGAIVPSATARALTTDGEVTRLCP